MLVCIPGILFFIRRFHLFDTRYTIPGIVYLSVYKICITNALQMKKYQFSTDVIELEPVFVEE